MDIDMRLDWVSRHDERSRGFGIADVVEAPVLRRRRSWLPGRILDQGSEGQCVGMAWAGEALASPVRVDLRRAGLGTAWPQDPQGFASAVYAAAQRIDEYPGEDYSGTSVLAGAKIMRDLGLIESYRWAFGVDEVITALLAAGPVILGIPWMSSMYDAPGGEVVVAGAVVGGHAIMATGYNPNRYGRGQGGIRLTNSWGPDWGIKGSAWLHVDALAGLLAQQGEACVPMGRRYGQDGPLKRLVRALDRR